MYQNSNNIKISQFQSISQVSISISDSLHLPLPHFLLPFNLSMPLLPLFLTYCSMNTFDRFDLAARRGMGSEKGAYKHGKSGLWAPPYSCTIGITQKTDDNWVYISRDTK